jgi:hypothetical protein
MVHARLRLLLQSVAAAALPNGLGLESHCDIFAITALPYKSAYVEVSDASQTVLHYSVPAAWNGAPDTITYL